MGLPGQATAGVAVEVEILELFDGLLDLVREGNLDVAGVGPETAREDACLFKQMVRNTNNRKKKTNRKLKGKSAGGWGGWRRVLFG